MDNRPNQRERLTKEAQDPGQSVLKKPVAAKQSCARELVGCEAAMKELTGHSERSAVVLSEM